MNSHAYAANNPIKNIDSDGNYVETAFDIAMFGLSVNDFRRNPSFGNGFAVLADGASIALPIPAVVGGMRHADDAARYGRKAVEGMGKVVENTKRNVNFAELGVTIERHEEALNVFDTYKHTNNLTNKEIAQRIAGGHAFNKHVLNAGNVNNLKEFGGQFRTRNQFANYIESVLSSPTAIKQMSGGRFGFYDKLNGGVIIVNTRRLSNGTAFQPPVGMGKNYFKYKLR